MEFELPKPPQTDNDKEILAETLWPEVRKLVDGEDEDCFKPVKVDMEKRTEGGKS